MPLDDAGTPGSDAFGERARSQADASRARRQAASQRRRGTRARVVVALAFLVIAVLAFLASGSSHHTSSAASPSRVRTIVSGADAFTHGLAAGGGAGRRGRRADGATPRAARWAERGPDLDRLRERALRRSCVGRGCAARSAARRAGATLGGAVYVFGGGQVQLYDHILRYDPSSGSVTVVGTLPSAASDVAVATLGETAYISAATTASHSLDTILASHPRVGLRTSSAHLREGLRYAAVAASGGRLLIAGGTTEGGASDAVLSFTPPTAASTGSCPRGSAHCRIPLTHARAAALGGRVYVVGGREQVSRGPDRGGARARSLHRGGARVGDAPPAALRCRGAWREEGPMHGGRGRNGRGSPDRHPLAHASCEQLVDPHPNPAAPARRRSRRSRARGFGAALRAHPHPRL